ncbi:MAG: nicotinate-nucleotide adenylyltransferase [Rhizobiaceae bacterium]|nr:nicotinate-nucleotide adenylyltransferase [Rhizobiaceae bacterium]
MPAGGDGARIGLFGGSFNPPHEGHLNLCELSLKRLKLDQIWWIVTPGNPLKDTSELPPLSERIQLSEDMIEDPRIKVTAFETRHKVRFTADTVRLVKKLRPRQHFVWLMGADNLASFHKWQDWRGIADTLPIAVIDRPGSTLSYRSARAALALSRYRVDSDDAPMLATLPAPAWTFIHGPRSSLSSTMLRNRQKMQEKSR